MCKEIILYDNTNLYDMRDEVRLELFEKQAEEQDWYLPFDVPDSMIDDEIHYRNSIEWDDIKYRLQDMLSNGHYLLIGYCGRWNGRCDGGKFIESFAELMNCICHLDCLTITDKDGHLYIDGYHHDGADHYELKKLTKKGYEFAGKNYFANDRKLHSTIFNNNFYSTLPRLAAI
ncbi:MAG: hypothetical protein RR313_11625 [Anaerovoracaceae bacterium]